MQRIDDGFVLPPPETAEDEENQANGRDVPESPEL